MAQNRVILLNLSLSQVIAQFESERDFRKAKADPNRQLGEYRAFVHVPTRLVEFECGGLDADASQKGGPHDQN